MAGMYPPTEPDDAGMLTVGDGHEIYWETCGNPAGRPVVMLHGGPGSGCTPGLRRWFDPEAYRIVLLDQRGAGRSTPSVADDVADLSANTTAHLVADLELLREHLGIGTWVVTGVSWGTTLALAYAQDHPDRVDALVLVSPVTTTHREVEWLTRDMGRIFPEEWQTFRDGAGPGVAPDGSGLAAAYSKLLHDPDPAVRERAARQWCDWEETHPATHPAHRPNPRFADPRFRLGFARVVTHYFAHAAFLDDGVLVRGMTRLAGIPGVIVAGRLDISSPPDVAWALHRAWPGSELVLVEGAGHGTTAEAIIAATDRFAGPTVS
ncbi:prolyl aminopeptidase [Georgenia muralis]